MFDDTSNEQHDPAQHAHEHEHGRHGAHHHHHDHAGGEQPHDHATEELAHDQTVVHDDHEHGVVAEQSQMTGGVAAQSQAVGSEQMRVPVVEESLNVQKAQRQAGEVQVRKNVVEEQVNVPVELSHEEVTVTRHAVDRPLQPGEATLGEGETLRVPVQEETAQVQKEARVTGEVEIGKQRVTEQRTVGDTVRREEVDVQSVGDLEPRGGQGTGGQTA